MRYWINRVNENEVIVALYVTRKEAGEICQELKTGDDSSQVSKDTFHLFMEVADGKEASLFGGAG